MSVEQERAVVNSALWAAAGDALGWITELGRESTVRARTGGIRVSEPSQWRRRIGGRGGVIVDLPAGTYSDDTQLRLGTCRAIRGNGVFDPEAFARIELTVWQSYSLGGGRGTKAAAQNLAKRGVNWFSNFFEHQDLRYETAGGNGAAMRVQPHVWSHIGRPDRFLPGVLKDSLITHGHAHGFCGAVFHAICLDQALSTRKVPDIAFFETALEATRHIPALVREDRQLEAFWLPAWANRAGRTLQEAIDEFLREAREDIALIWPHVNAGRERYSKVLELLGCYKPQYRGSGWKTALAASSLAWMYRDGQPENALVAAANELESDTDTIATMAGALLGAVATRQPEWEVQDRDYIEREARRLSAVSRGEVVDSFSYPDLARWQPPTSQSDVVSGDEEGYVVAGLGVARPMGREYAAGAYVWQWLELPFGQSLLAKRRRQPAARVHRVLPGERRMAQRLDSNAAAPNERELPLTSSAPVSQPAREKPVPGQELNGISIDRLTDSVIRSEFDDATLGRMLNLLIERTASIELAVAFASIIAKAKLSRKRKPSP